MLARASFLAPPSTTRLPSRARRHRVPRRTTARATDDTADETEGDDEGAAPSRSMLEFAEAGFPSEKTTLWILERAIAR